MKRSEHKRGEFDAETVGGEIRRVAFPRTSAGFALAFASLTDAVVMVGPESDESFPADRLWVVPRAEADRLEAAGFLPVPPPADDEPF
jgi:hypothetical protein